MNTLNTKKQIALENGVKKISPMLDRSHTDLRIELEEKFSKSSVVYFKNFDREFTAHFDKNKLVVNLWK